VLNKGGKRPILKKGLQVVIKEKKRRLEKKNGPKEKRKHTSSSVTKTETEGEISGKGKFNRDERRPTACPKT